MSWPSWRTTCTARALDDERQEVAGRPPRPGRATPAGGNERARARREDDGGHETRTQLVDDDDDQQTKRAREGSSHFSLLIRTVRASSDDNLRYSLELICQPFSNVFFFIIN
jgi:hypothetical protein